MDSQSTSDYFDSSLMILQLSFGIANDASQKLLWAPVLLLILPMAMYLLWQGQHSSTQKVSTRDAIGKYLLKGKFSDFIVTVGINETKYT